MNLCSLLSFPLVGNPSSKKDCGQAAMTEKEYMWPYYDSISKELQRVERSAEVLFATKPGRNQ
jgi:hypothetical protein